MDAATNPTSAVAELDSAPSAGPVPDPTVADLGAIKRWVAWRTEPREAGEKPTKIPKCPMLQRNAASNNPLTWSNRQAAEAAHARLPTSPHGPGGIGIMLGDIGDGRTLAGIDLDRCRDPISETIEPWAAEILARLQTYAEISPSETGIKLFFFIASTAIPDLRHLLSGGTGERKFGRKWAWSGADHTPGIELYLGSRFFTVTDRRLMNVPAGIATVSTDAIAWLIREAAPRFKTSDPVARSADKSAAPGNDALMHRLQAAMKANTPLAQRWEGSTIGLSDGTRSGLAFALGGALKRAGFTRAEMGELLRRNAHTATWAAEKGVPVGERELDRIWQNTSDTWTGSSDSTDRSEPQPLFRSLPPAEVYPVDALGGLLAEAAQAIHMRTQAPPAICAQSILGVAALCAQPFADVLLPTGEQKPCSLDLLTIAESGERKTACDGWALRGVRDREEQLRQAHQGDLQAWRNDHDAWTKTRGDILNKEKDREGRRRRLDELGLEPLAPLSPLLLVNEPTLEGLAKLYGTGWPSLGLFAGEAGSFLGGHGMTEEAKTRTAAGLSDLWDGTPIKRVRSGDGAVVLPGRRLSTHLMAQPAIADLLVRDSLIAGAGGQGLVNRFLISAPDTAAGTRLFHDPPAEAEMVLRRFAAVVMDRLSRPWPGERQILTPRPLALSAAARAEWIGFQHGTERAIGPSGQLVTIRGFGNKLAEHAARIAAVLTIFADPDAAEISAAAMGSGVELAQYYAAEALRLTDAARISTDVMLADKVRLWLATTWPEPLVSLPDIYQHGPNAVRERAKAQKVVTMLEEHGHLVRIDGGAEIRGSRRREAWQIIRAAAKP